MSSWSINKHNIEEESFLILNEIIKNELKGSEIAVGHDLITFIQYFLIMETLYPTNYLNKICENLCFTSVSKLNNAILSNNCHSKLSVLPALRFLKEILLFIQFNRKIEKCSSSFQSVVYTRGYDRTNSKRVDRKKIDLIYSMFKQTVKVKPSYLEKLVSRYLSKYQYYSGKFAYNSAILRAFQLRRNKSLTSYAIQHGGHNYVSSEYNVFLYPEYGDYFIPVVAGKELPIISGYTMKNISFLLSRDSPLINRENYSKSVQVVLILGQRVNKPLRIDGNPLFNEIGRWNEYVVNFISNVNDLHCFVKYYPGQEGILKDHLMDLETVKSIEDCYGVNKILVCDHYGTTFLQSLYKGYLCLLLIDLGIFNIRAEIVSLITPFIIDSNTSKERIESIYQAWYSGGLDEARKEIIDKLYRSDQIF